MKFYFSFLLWSASWAFAAEPAALAYCGFESVQEPCGGTSKVSVLRAHLDPEGRLGSALRICKGAGCPASSTIRLNGKPISTRRGSVAFWFRLNSLNPTSGPTEIFSSYPGPPYVTGGFRPSLSREIEVAESVGQTTRIRLSGHGLTSGERIRLSGAAGQWAALDGEWTITRVDDNLFTIALNSSTFGVFVGRAHCLGPGSVTFRYYSDPAGITTYGQFSTDSFFMETGVWQHIVWSWVADVHKVYRNGRLVTESISTSPFPFESTFNYLSLGVTAGGFQDISIDEFGTYNYTLSGREVETLAQSNHSGPPAALDRHGLNLSVEWAPGEAKVKVAADVGNDLETRADKVRVEVRRDGGLTGSFEFAQLRNGFAERVFDLTTFPSGKYSVSASAWRGDSRLDAVDGKVFDYTQPEWLGHGLGVNDSVPAPYWDPITVDERQTVHVVHRSYHLAGGFGLPMQIVALDKEILAAPVSLELWQGGQNLAITPVAVEFQTKAGHETTWTGKGSASGIDISVRGKMEYDGMMLTSITLTPTHGPVKLDGIQLRTALTDEAAKYVHAVKDQTFYWYTWAARPPTEAGEFNHNLTERPKKAKTHNIFSVLFSDNDRGLQIFHNNMAGWRINEAQPWQRFLRGVGGEVILQEEIANTAFTLDEPLEFSVGWMATPVKRLPPGWRLAAGGAYGGTRAPESPYEYHFDFTMGQGWNTFQLYPFDLGLYKRNRTLPTRQSNPVQGKRVLPFVNAHVLVPTPPLVWGDLQILKAETLNDGWLAAPSRGMADYWTWSLNRVLNDPAHPDVVDGYYVDETYTYPASASLLTGGYVKPDGAHGFGLNLLAAREKFQRLAKLLIQAGKAPNIWFHTTATMYPHMLSHGLMTFDGERPVSGFNYMVKSDAVDNKDHFDHWNDNGSLLDPSQTGSGPWLLGVARSTKFGFIPNMWGGIECCAKPFAPLRQRQAQCLFQLHDMIQQDQTRDWWQTKFDFGIHAEDTRFRGYWEGAGIRPDSPSVKVSYYDRAGGSLAYVANFSGSTYTGDLTFDAEQFGPAGKLRIFDAETKRPLQEGLSPLRLSVNRHDCRVLLLVRGE